MFSDTALKKAECLQLQKLLIPTPTAQSEEKTSTSTGWLLLVHLGMTFSCTSVPMPEASACWEYWNTSQSPSRLSTITFLQFLLYHPAFKWACYFRFFPEEKLNHTAPPHRGTAQQWLWGPSACFHVQKARASKELKATQFPTSSNWSVRAGG